MTIFVLFNFTLTNNTSLEALNSCDLWVKYELHVLFLNGAVRLNTRSDLCGCFSLY